MGGSTSELRKCVKTAQWPFCEANDNTCTLGGSQVDHTANNMLQASNIAGKWYFKSVS